MVGSGLRTIWAALMVGALLFSCGESSEDGGHGNGSSGGATSSGGASAPGGSPSSGGGNALGGASASGGSTLTGGSTASGGAGAAGAATTGGADDGGSGGTAGSAGSGGEAGSGEAGAAGASGRPLQPVGTIPADKIDLLFVIDNSISMADKQTLLRDAVPLLVQRLVTPVCVDAAGIPNGQHARANGTCAAGEPEFPPIRDFHIGVISSSLGSHGGDFCNEDGSTSTPNGDDRAQLLPSMRTGLTSWNDSGFLAWDPEGRANPTGANDATVLVHDFQDMVVAAGDGGCGYESTLEAWYRFLVDADPPTSVKRNTAQNGVDIVAPNQIVLDQRRAFLRPDSLVGIVVLSDENDCSIIDGGQAYLTGTSTLSASAFRMPRSTSACATDPNDTCCFSCAMVGTPSGCTPPAEDSECMKGYYLAQEDAVNLRCFDQKRRFGFDFLQPLQRYVDGLSASEVLDRSGQPQKNPLFEAPTGMRPRDASHVFFLAIVGVPWQDVADDASLNDANHLRYLSVAELEAKGRFALMLPENGELPEDGLMFETSADRSTLGFGPHPLTGDELVPSTSTDPTANPINGHETSIASNDDLQYSCIFPLSTPRDCSAAGLSDCDCTIDETAFARPLCQPPSGGPAGTTQYYAKAYPGLRHIELARQFGRVTNNAVVASICPKVLTATMPSTSPTYGYNPGISALVDRMKAALAPSCLATPLPADASGSISCNVLEVTSGANGCSCDGAGRAAASRSADRELRSRLAASAYCGGPGQPTCESLCVCELSEVPSSDLGSCQNDASVAADLAGYCYLDAGQGFGATTLLEPCPVDRKRRLRFVGSDVPRANSSTYVLCPQ